MLSKIANLEKKIMGLWERGLTCPDCGYVFSPVIRIASLGEAKTCPKCGCCCVIPKIPLFLMYVCGFLSSAWYIRTSYRPHSTLSAQAIPAMFFWGYMISGIIFIPIFKLRK